jgi:Domain of unknown function (DUF4349)
MSQNDPSPLASFGKLSRPRRTLLIILALFAGLLLFARIAKPPVGSAIRSNNDAHLSYTPLGGSTEGVLEVDRKLAKESLRPTPPGAAPLPYAGIRATDASAGETPLISHASELAVSTKEFSRSRATLEDILERHHGYAAHLRMSGQPTGSTLTATLRFPSSEFSSTVTDLKTLGNVEREEETADEIVQQRADLEARLINARGRLQHLQELRAKAGPKDNFGEIQRQLAAVASEIASLEAERVAWEHRTIFANVFFTMREEITPPVESFGGQFRKAALSGLSDAINSLSAILLFAIGYGPVILLWIVLVFFPARWIWRKWRPSMEPAAPRTA